MNTIKESEFAFVDDGKESFRERLKKLIGTRSIRGAARQWGLSFSTLNNYLNKGTEPSFSAIRRIAHVEQVSLDWLAFGAEVNLCSKNLIHEEHNDHAPSSDNKLTAAWFMVLESTEPEEALKLIKLIHRKGIERVIEEAPGKGSSQATQHEFTELERALLQLPTEEQERLMALHEAKKGASEECGVTGPQSLTDKHKRAV